ncbi:MAG: HD domain-containing protein [Saprospiraceae bacterium]|nr:HD domain-containing protein [Saprospiraceae bacterium]
MTEQDILNLLQPETELERRLILEPAMLEGLMWGEPRYGHPEGKVVYHIVDVFENIRRVSPPLSNKAVEQMRLVALLHDSFKYIESKEFPRDWTRHHSILARQFAEKFINDTVVLDIIELHDEAYYCWRLAVLDDETEQAEARFQSLLQRCYYCFQLYYTFFRCDTATGDKTQAPVKWFEKKELPIRKVILVGG